MAASHNNSEFAKTKFPHKFDCTYQREVKYILLGLATEGECSIYLCFTSPAISDVDGIMRLPTPSQTFMPVGECLHPLRTQSLCLAARELLSRKVGFFKDTAAARNVKKTKGRSEILKTEVLRMCGFC